MAKIVIKKSRTYNYLSNGGTKAIKHGCGEIDHEIVANEAQMIVQALTGKGYNASDLWVILHVADQAIIEFANSQKI